ncbi:DEAD/DEAH box helicase [Mycobacterium colombiense]|uniref:Putative helicase n=1 Tax=Mycobacterium colombiense CECT 3035 TaxID=1041522 RepID=J4JUX8_9MYCO|nr:DEAD/DEAH box helicase [Mycobacterium colombiense]EJO88062.1 putative helicase [Mycobacterium colombiense CECT 3035]
MGVFTDLFNQLDADDRVKGKQFEHICKWFLTNDPVYKHELRRVWLWGEWPGRWGGDAGIDLVAEDRQGHLWAIQAKAYSPAYRVTKRDVNKFLAESGRPEFTYRMLIATTNLIDRIGERTIQDQDKRVTFFRLSDLEAANVAWPRSPKDLRPAPQRKPARPRKYQREAISKVLKGFALAERGQLIMACGTGKTLTALFVNEELGAARTLVLAPSLSLLKQTLNAWRANSTNEFASLPVCSDDTVANTDDDVALAHTSDIGVPAEADPERIAAFLRQRSCPRVIFATYQSSPQIAKAFALGKVPAFDLVIADEAHRCAGKASSDFATVLDADKIKAKRRLFMTATPRYFTGRVLKAAKDAEFEYASMDDEAKFGKVFHRLSFGEAIKRDLLTDYQVAIVGVDNATYLDWANNRMLVTRDGVEVSDAAELAGQIGLVKAIRKYDLHRIISFHSRVKRAREFAASMPDVLTWMPARQRPKGKLWSKYASGEMPAGDRYVLLQHLGHLDDGDRGLLANARCLAEGVDVPTLDGVAFIDPRRSEVDIVQAVGRAIRKSEDKTVGTIVIPVFIDTDADAETALDSSAFKPVWDVIKALRAHDEELGEQLDELRRAFSKKRGRLRLPDKIHVDIPIRVNAEFARAFDVRLVQQTTASWEEWFAQMELFTNEHGHGRVPFSYVVGDYQLGRWVNAQRNNHFRGTLDAERERRLEQLPGWTWTARADKWEDGLDLLQMYVEEHGDALVPYTYEVDKYKLGIWIATQRSRYTRGILDADRRHRLEALPGWTWDVDKAQWEEGFSRLVCYVERHGDTLVPHSYTDDGYSLGNWVAVQRRDHTRGVLDDDRDQRLQKIPEWTWTPNTDRWEKGFTQLRQYVDRHGDACVPSDKKVKGFNLGRWVVTQRRFYSNGRLDADRQRRLEELPGWSWTRQADQWEKGLAQLLLYVEQHCDASVPQSCKLNGFGLGSWVNAQRAKYAKGALDADRVRRLANLPGWTWNPLTAQWEEGFNRLLAYVEQHGDARVPQSYTIDGYKLGQWVINRRSDYRKGTLNDRRQQELDAVPGWAWDPKADKWENGFTRLLAYVEREGDARVPASYRDDDGYKLGGWVLTQRISRIDGTIDSDRERRLDEVPGWSWAPKLDRWEEGFARLLDYVARHGDARVPDEYLLNGFRLGQWVGVQRGAHRKGTLGADRERRLDELPGWTWVLFADQWEDGFKRLREYVEHHGDARVPQSYKVDGYGLGVWVGRQRREYKKGTLDVDRQRRLERVRGWTWDPHADRWEQSFVRLEEYVKDHGDARVPDAYKVDGYALGAWVGIQRASHRKGALDTVRRRRLEELPGWTWSALRTDG